MHTTTVVWHKALVQGNAELKLGNAWSGKRP